MHPAVDNCTLLGRWAAPPTAGAPRTRPSSTASGRRPSRRSAWSTPTSSASTRSRTTATAPQCDRAPRRPPQRGNGAGTYAYVDVDAEAGQVNALGTDAIKVGMLYKPAVVTPIGTTAALNTQEFVSGGDTAPRSRPSLAQAFEVNATGGTFVADVNHLKSKGSACAQPDPSDGQGNCNARAHESRPRRWPRGWPTDPTGTGESDAAHPRRPQRLRRRRTRSAPSEQAGYTNLVRRFLGDEAYSYVFDGQWGYLDHALGSAGLVGQVDRCHGVPHQRRRAVGARLQHRLQVHQPGRGASTHPTSSGVSDHDPSHRRPPPNTAAQRGRGVRRHARVVRPRVRASRSTSATGTPRTPTGHRRVG